MSSSGSLYLTVVDPKLTRLSPQKLLHRCIQLSRISQAMLSRSEKPRERFSSTLRAAHGLAPTSHYSHRKKGFLSKRCIHAVEVKRHILETVILIRACKFINLARLLETEVIFTSLEISQCIYINCKLSKLSLFPPIVIVFLLKRF